MSRTIEEALAVLNSAKGGEFALKWFDDYKRMVGKVPWGSTERVQVVSVQVSHGSATPEGKAATFYINKAFEELLPKLLEYAENHARADIDAGKELLK